jgi:hypothetical protein
MHANSVWRAALTILESSPLWFCLIGGVCFGAILASTIMWRRHRLLTQKEAVDAVFTVPLQSRLRTQSASVVLASKLIRAQQTAVIFDKSETVAGNMDRLSDLRKVA